MNRRVAMLAVSAGLVLALSSVEVAPAFTPGNVVLVTNNRFLKEFTLEGVAVGEPIAIPQPDTGATERVRDVAIDTRGRAFVFNGTFRPFISVFTPGAGWANYNMEDWSIGNNTMHGCLAVVDDFVFVPDNLGTLKGVLRYDLTTQTHERRSATTSPSNPDFNGPIDVKLGLDGRIYSLAPDGSPSGSRTFVIDPQSFETLDNIDNFAAVERQSVTGIAVNGSGTRFLLQGLERKVLKVSTDNVEVGSLALQSICSTCSFYAEVELDGKGNVMLPSGRGFILTNESLDGGHFSTVLPASESASFGAIVPYSGDEPQVASQWVVR